MILLRILCLPLILIASICYGMGAAMDVFGEGIVWIWTGQP